MKIEKIVKAEQFITSISKKLKVEEIPNFLPQTFMKLVEYINDKEATILSAPFVCYRNLRDDFDLVDGMVDIEVGFPLDRNIDETSEIKSYILGQYKAVTTLYVGKYEDMSETYFALAKRITEIGGIFKNRSYEYYLSDEDVDLEQQETIIELVYE